MMTDVWIKQRHTWPPVKQVSGWFNGKHFYWLDGPNNPQQEDRSEVFTSEILALESCYKDTAADIASTIGKLKSLRHVFTKTYDRLETLRKTNVNQTS